MDNFGTIKEALEYIDDHLGEELSFELLAGRFHFSAYYFHRMFGVIVGKTITRHIRDRRLARACSQLSGTDKPVIEIALDCGYNSAEAFSRAFRSLSGFSPSEYRRAGIAPDVVTVDEMIRKFTNRLRGGVFVNPKIIRRDKLFIAGVAGDGNKTGQVWATFMKLLEKTPVDGKISDNGYEIRRYEGGRCTVHVGLAVPDDKVREPYAVMALPASKYASFDVYVANGYDSENSAMDEWLRSNNDGYTERLLGDAHCAVEYYDERFCGSEAGSIVEIWIPIKKKPPKK